jgi:hypothetical protein
MTKKFASALAAGALAVGIVVGAAGTVVVHDATRPAMGMGDMTQMMGMMDGGMMRGTPVGPALHDSHHRGDR